MDLFRPAHGWRGWQKAPPSLKSVTHILYTFPKDQKKYINHVTQPLSSADIRITLPENSNFCFKKYRYRLHFNT